MADLLQPITRQALVSELSAGGVQPGMIVMVHSSLKSIGHVEGGAPAVVQALVEAVRPGGTVLFPALTFTGSLTLFMRAHATVDLRHSPPMVGAIPRAAANYPSARQSIHPTHPVIAIGPAADELFSGNQSGQGPCGAASPFYKAAMAGGYILLIGVGNSTNTTLHCVEELAAPYMNRNGVFHVQTIDHQGHSHMIAVKGFPVGLARNFDVINPALEQEGIMTNHTLGNAPTRLINGRRMIEYVTEWIGREPNLLVDNPASPAGTKGK